MKVPRRACVAIAVDVAWCMQPNYCKIWLNDLFLIHVWVSFYLKNFVFLRGFMGDYG